MALAPAAQAGVPGPSLSVITGASPLDETYGVAVDSQGDLFASNEGDGAIIKVNPQGQASEFYAGCEPMELATASNGGLLVADDCDDGIERVNPDGLASVVPGTSGIHEPTGVATDPSGNVYVSVGYRSSPVEKVTPSGRVSVLADASHFGNTWSLAADSAGNVYVADPSNGTVDKITASGTFSVIAGAVGGNTPATNYAFDSPTGVAVDPAGNVFISDAGAAKVLEVKPSGSIVTVVGTGTSGSPTPGNPLESELYGPQNLAISTTGELFIADTDDSNSAVEGVTGLAALPAPDPGSPSVAGGGVVFPWTPNPAATSYTVTVYVNGIAQAPVTGVTGSPYVVEHPVPGATYSFTVAAVDGAGPGPASARSNSVMAPTTSSSGYWLVGGDGGVFSYGTHFYGSTGNLKLNQPVFAITSTKDGKGYWFVARDGGVFSYGDAKYHGSVPSVGVHVTDIVGMAEDEATGGYWLVGRDGGVYAFDAPFHGSVPELGDHVADIVGITATADGGGYDLVSSTGAVYSFGDARYHGGANTMAHLNAPVVGISLDAATGGYWEAGSDGGVYAYDAPFDGSAGGLHLSEPVVGISATPSGSGYWLVGADGGVFAEHAPYLGSMGGKHLNSPVVGITAAG